MTPLHRFHQSSSCLQGHPPEASLEPRSPEPPSWMTAGSLTGVTREGLRRAGGAPGTQDTHWPCPGDLFACLFEATPNPKTLLGVA